MISVQYALAVAGDTGTGPGRLGAIVAAVVALIGVAVGVLALRRSDADNRPLSAAAAIVVGLIGTVLGAVQLARSTGGFGTGNGRAGAIVAMVVGLIAMVLGGLALARSRRHGRVPADR
jgi:multisubunit Na+/H+ antiporter MnhB subunit